MEATTIYFYCQIKSSFLQFLFIWPSSIFMIGEVFSDLFSTLSLVQKQNTAEVDEKVQLQK